MKFFLLIIFIGLIAFVFIRSKKSQEIQTDTRAMPVDALVQDSMKEDVQTFSISGFSEDGISTWEVSGESADILSETVDIDMIHAKAHSDKISVTLRADEGTFFKASKDLELRKNVVANTDEGATLRTHKLKWLAESEKIETDEGVSIERHDIKVSGTGAVAEPSMKKVQFNKDIKMEIRRTDPDAAESDLRPATIITCDGPLEVDYQNNISFFNNNVVIEDKEGKIYADKVTVYIDPKEKKIKKAIAKGNVKIVHRDNVSYSEEAIYFAQEGRVILAGRPKVVIYSVDGPAKDKNPI